MAGAHGLDCAIHAALQAGNHLFDLFGRLLGTARQGTHFVGHNGKAPPLLASPGRLDGSVQGQQVGLFGNALDHLEHPADRGAVIGQLIDGLDRVVDLVGQLLYAVHRGFHQLSARKGFLVDQACAGYRAGSTARHLLGSRRHFVHRGCHLLDLRPLGSHRSAALAGNPFHLL